MAALYSLTTLKYTLEVKYELSSIAYFWSLAFTGRTEFNLSLACQELLQMIDVCME